MIALEKLSANIALETENIRKISSSPFKEVSANHMLGFVLSRLRNAFSIIESLQQLFSSEISSENLKDLETFLGKLESYAIHNHDFLVTHSDDAQRYIDSAINIVKVAAGCALEKRTGEREDELRPYLESYFTNIGDFLRNLQRAILIADLPPSPKLNNGKIGVPAYSY